MDRQAARASIATGVARYNYLSGKPLRSLSHSHFVKSQARIQKLEGNSLQLRVGNLEFDAEIQAVHRTSGKSRK